MPEWVLLVVLALAVARVTGLIVLDEVTRPVREAILRRLDENQPVHRGLAYLISCVWCSGLWVSAVAAPLAYWYGDRPWLWIPATALAFSQVAGSISNLGRG